MRVECTKIYPRQSLKRKNWSIFVIAKINVVCHNDHHPLRGRTLSIRTSGSGRRLLSHHRAEADRIRVGG